MTKWYKQEKLRLRRKAQRAKLGLLRDLVIKPVTRRRYGAMVSRFFRWRKEKRLGAIRSEREMDRECARFLGYLWEEGEPKQKGADFVSGVQHYCEGLRKRLPRTWRWYGAWNRYEKGDHAPPMERRVALAVADIFWRWGYPRTAVLVLVFQHGYLRTGEALGLRMRDVVISPEGTGILNLGVTKGRRVEMVTLDDGPLGRLLEEVTEGLGLGELVSEMGMVEFRWRFKAAVRKLGLKRIGYKPYSLRRGGATEDFKEHGRFDRAMLRGRWRSVAAARVYILEGLAAYTRLRRSPEEEEEVLARGARMCRRMGC